ncbi:MAG TPA: ATP-dependent DNA helicase [Candidatus Dormibacteraeota bacterium]|nr:ATP-dependent DNA helicase [Candidatus Dormibacteraeota bacterium]
MSQREDFLARAQQALTPAQFDVVQELGKGPIKVVAAAGSGKTTTMAWLYAAALVDHHAVGEIMAVTFTDRAAAELRQKVLAVMVEVGLAPTGSQVDPLDRAWIGTFHQLIRRLLGERAYLAGVARDLELIDEIAAGMVMEEAVAAVRHSDGGGSSWLQHLPRDSDPRTLLAVLAGARWAVARLRSTELTPSQCESRSLAAYARAAELGDPPEEVAWNRAAMHLTIAIWREYERRLTVRRALDFDGLLRQGLQSLRQSPELLAWCRANFRLLIVDEYQDTSALQESLIHQLSGPHHQSLFMVGDARQSIYAFRDAKPGIMTDALGRQFGLFRNHRSRMTILTAADHVIRADPTFADDEKMVAARESDVPLPVYLAELENQSLEAETIARALDEIHRQGVTYPDGSHREVAWREMAVLAYTHSQIGGALEEALRLRQIPFQTATGGLLDRPEVRDVMAFLRLAADDRDDLACMRILQSQVGRLPDQALVELRPRTPRPIPSLAQRLRQHLAAGARGWEPAWVERSSRLLAVVELLRQEAETAGAADLVASALARSGLLHLQQARVRAGDSRGRRALASIRELQRLVWRAESPGSWLTLAGLLFRLEAMRGNAETAEPPAQTEEDLVTLSTIHRAKGLEWPVVALADCRPQQNRGPGLVYWDRDEEAVVCGRIDGHDTAARKRWKKGPEATVEREERRRLVYVAMTRARDLLLVTTTRRGKDSDFGRLAEALEAAEVWIGEWPVLAGGPGLPWLPPSASAPGTEPVPSPPPGRTVSTSRLLERWQELEHLEQAGWRQPVQPSRLSFSSLEILQRCPRQFWYQYLAHYPTPVQGPRLEPDPDRVLDPEAAAGEQARTLGVAVHQILEHLHEESPDRAPSLTQALAALELFAKEIGPEQKVVAEGMLRRYLTGPSAALPTVATEFAFSWSGWAGSDAAPPLVGVIDRIARLPSGELLIIDYKTNAALSESDLVDYSRQLRLYAAALAAGVMGVPLAPPATALAMLRSGELITVPSAEEQRQEALDWAASAARRVRRGEYRSDLAFPDRPCASCPFLERCPERRPEVAARLFGELEKI